MIDITVRTLNSQNHHFTVNEEFTVLEFKHHIAETVNIPAETQRIIFCGRVLSDDSKLKDLDVNGKVVHLVERPPPSDNPQPGPGNNRDNLSQGQPHVHQRVFGGNAVYLGSMAALPFETQNLVTPAPSYRLAGNRLNVARRMLRRIETGLNLLENPARRAPAPQAEDEEMEVTHVFEAHSSIIPGSVNTTEADRTETPTTPSGAQGVPNQTNLPNSASIPPTSTEENASNAATNTRNNANNSSTTNGPTQGPAQENVSRTWELAELLERLVQLQLRFAPFLERYRTFLREDPLVSAEDVPNTDRTIMCVSDILHTLGHAYHSLSDQIVRARNPPPRRLVCHPILHTAVVPAGLPIQVEAQINFSSDPQTMTMPPNSTANATSNTTNTSTNGASNMTSTATNTADDPSSGRASAGTNTDFPSATSNENANMNTNRTPRVTIPQFEFMNIPGLQAVPIGIRTMRSGGTPTPAGNTQNQETNPNTQSGVFNNPNIEFYMELTPESITIDSLETTLLGATAGNATDGTRTHVQPPPEVLQSLMQVAGQFVNRGASTSNVTSSSQNQTTESSSPNSQQQTNGSTPGQNSQARGNTQTNPTTATHTRSTSRPHVHFSQHGIPGFDPFLPCNSHHVSSINHPFRRQSTFAPTNLQSNNNNTRPQNGNMAAANQMNPVINLVQGVLNTLQTAYRRNTPQQQSQAQPATQTQTAPSATPPNNSVPAGGVDRNLLQSTMFANLPSFLIPHMQNINSNDAARGPTIAQLLQEAGDQTEGEGIFNDIVMLLSQNFSIRDIVQLNAGRLDPLLRIRNELRVFVIDRILEGNQPSAANVERAVNKLITEMQPFLDHLSHMPVRGDIDIVRSVQTLFRTRLPHVINLAVSRRPNAMRNLVDQLRLVWKHLCALILHASGNGQRGVEDIMNRIVANYTEGISPVMQELTQMATRAQLHDFLHTINVPESALQPYIVRNVDSVTAPVTVASESPESEQSSMEADADLKPEEDNASASSVLGEIRVDENDDLPPVVMGSESWHEQVPTDWVPIIARDTQRQRRQSQGPLSDGYLAGMPSKRRKVVTSGKPQGTLPQVITEGLRQAVTTSGLATVGNLEEVIQEAGADLSIQSAYRDLLRTSVQSTIQDNADFTPERFPNASIYFNKPQ